ncbi:MAG: hypothetical protein JNG84_13160 [Archangium sp.]|nr:hypothetical protein [Archangium sp.]
MSWLLMVVLGQVVTAETDATLAFAEHLVTEHDTYRAITELKRFGFTRGGAFAVHADLRIGQLYAGARQVDASRFHLGRAMSGGPPARTAAQLLEASNVCLTRRLWENCGDDLAALSDETPLGLKPYLSAFVDVMLARPPPGPLVVAPPLAEAAHRLEALRLERAALPLKTPWLAGVLSAVLPGAGQVSNGRFVDAGLAFALTGGAVAGAVALLARRQPEWGFGISLAVLASVFYVGNIVNAVGDAHRINEQRLDAFARTLEAQAWPRFDVALSPSGAAFTLTMKLGSSPAKVPVLTGGVQSAD